APAAGTAATPDHAGYYSQPARAALFTPEPGGPFLEALPLEAAPLPYPASSPYAPNASFPAAPFAGIEAPASRQQPGNRRSEGDWLDGLRRFEAEVLGAARTQAIYALEPNAAGRAIPPRDGPSGGNDSAATAVTPQGLLSVFS